MVCREDFETRHPQEFVRAVKENNLLPFVRPDNDGALSGGSVGLVDALGDGTLTTAYRVFMDSSSNSVISFTLYLVVGSTTTFNSGAWTVTLPVTNGGNVSTGHAELIAKNKLYRGTLSIAADASSGNVTDNDTNAQWSDTVPQTFSEGDRLLITIRYGTET
jgi:hypothetical protein